MTHERRASAVRSPASAQARSMWSVKLLSGPLCRPGPGRRPRADMSHSGTKRQSVRGSHSRSPTHSPPPACESDPHSPSAGRRRLINPCQGGVGCHESRPHAVVGSSSTAPSCGGSSVSVSACRCTSFQSPSSNRKIMTTRGAPLTTPRPALRLDSNRSSSKTYDTSSPLPDSPRQRCSCGLLPAASGRPKRVGKRDVITP